MLYGSRLGQWRPPTLHTAITSVVLCLCLSVWPLIGHGPANFRGCSTLPCDPKINKLFSFFSIFFSSSFFLTTSGFPYRNPDHESEPRRDLGSRIRTQVAPGFANPSSGRAWVRDPNQSHACVRVFGLRSHLGSRIRTRVALGFEFPNLGAAWVRESEPGSRLGSRIRTQICPDSRDGPMSRSGFSSDSSGCRRSAPTALRRMGK